MDETVYKIALAGFFHDIGKFAERANMEVSNDFFNNYAFLVPYYNNRHTHKHAIYTAAFIDKFESLLPKEFNKLGWGLEDSFFSLTAGHHKPETPLQWIIAIADRVSSGFDRSEFEDYNNEIALKDYKKTRLLPIFESILTNKNSIDDYTYRYPLAELSPMNIFPSDDKALRNIDDEYANRDYERLFQDFLDALENLEHKNCITLWFEHFDSLFKIYTSHIPAASVGKVIPDVSLYDHAYTTSAIASALYRFHKDTNTIDDINSIKNYDTNKFLLVSGDFYGIQDFIFPEGGSSGRFSAKILRGRSFYVSLLSELTADFICKKLDLPITSIILNAAGKFTILAHNTENSKKIIDEVEEEINEWLIKNFFGQVAIGFSYIEASCNDFTTADGRFARHFDKLSKEVNKRKYSKFDLKKYGGVISNYIDSFNNELGICPFCNKRPADEKAKLREDITACAICADHIFIGENIVKEEQIAITKKDAEIFGKKLQVPIFDEYQLFFPTGDLKKLVAEKKVFKLWNIGISQNGYIAKNTTAKFINGYIPKYEQSDLKTENVDRIIAGKKSEKMKEELFDSMELDVPKTFAYLSKMALNKVNDKFVGIEALGIFKADVDNLGYIFSCGIPERLFTISRLATLSRQMNNFFTIYLPFKLKNDLNFKNIYTVFAGGDDLFLIGPWNKITDFAFFIKEEFKKYVCNNEKITISAGIAIHKPNTPVLKLAESSENALEKSKKGGRFSITIFNETVNWKTYEKLLEIKEKLSYWIDNEIINNAMLFRLNEIIDMRKQEEGIIKGGVINIEDMECLKWRSILRYSIVRNVGRKKKGDEKVKLIEEVMELAKWLEDYGSALKIPLWQIIYNRRK